MAFSIRVSGDAEPMMEQISSGYRDEIDDRVGDWSKKSVSRLKDKGYPAQSGRPQPFKTDRQRRFFFAALNSGFLSVPYQRTHNLTSSFVARSNGWADWVVESPLSYAGLVVGRGQQSGYHAANWWVAEDVVEDDIGDLEKDIAKGIEDLA